MEFRAKDIAGLLNGTVEGNPDEAVSQLAKIEEGTPGSIAFLSNEKYTEYIYTTRASIVIVNNGFVPGKALPDTLTLVRVADARASFGQLLKAYHQARTPEAGISASAVIGEGAKVDAKAHIGANSTVGNMSSVGAETIVHPNVSIGENVTIGKGCVIHSGVRIMNDCVIGNHCTLQPNCVIGSEGFGFAPNSANNYEKVVHIGNVILEDHVEIGSNTTIDRGTLGSTIIRKGVKLDNLIQVAHNVDIGENTVMAAQVGIAGSTKIGKNCMVGGQVGIVGHISIADEVKIAAQSGISKDVTEKGAILMGSPAIAIGDFKKSFMLFRRLPSIKKQLDKLVSKHG